MPCAAGARQLGEPQRVLEIDLAKCGPRTRLAHGCAERAEDVVRDEPVTHALERREVRQHLPQLRRGRLAVDVTARQRNHRRPRRMRQEPSQAFATDETGRSGDAARFAPRSIRGRRRKGRIGDLHLRHGPILPGGFADLGPVADHDHRQVAGFREVTLDRRGNCGGVDGSDACRVIVDIAAIETEEHHVGEPVRELAVGLDR